MNPYLSLVQPCNRYLGNIAMSLNYICLKFVSSGVWPTIAIDLRSRVWKPSKRICPRGWTHLIILSRRPIQLFRVTKACSLAWKPFLHSCLCSQPRLTTCPRVHVLFLIDPILFSQISNHRKERSRNTKKPFKLLMSIDCKLTNACFDWNNPSRAGYSHI